jgi:hypothetical protein
MAFLSSFCTLEMILPPAQIPAGIYIIFSGVLHARNPNPKYLIEFRGFMQFRGIP